VHESSGKEAKGSKDFSESQLQASHREAGYIGRYFTDNVPKAIQLEDISFSFNALCHRGM
jgi:hypothetical protein